MKSTWSAGGPSSAVPSPHVSGPAEFRKMLHEEEMEMREREKRVDSALEPPLWGSGPSLREGRWMLSLPPGAPLAVPIQKSEKTKLPLASTSHVLVKYCTY